MWVRAPGEFVNARTRTGKPSAGAAPAPRSAALPGPLTSGRSEARKALVQCEHAFLSSSSWIPAVRILDQPILPTAGAPEPWARGPGSSTPHTPPAWSLLDLLTWMEVTTGR